jgi:hypothetical protein
MQRSSKGPAHIWVMQDHQTAASLNLLLHITAAAAAGEGALTGGSCACLNLLLLLLALPLLAAQLAYCGQIMSQEAGRQGQQQPARQAAVHKQQQRQQVESD